MGRDVVAARGQRARQPLCSLGRRASVQKIPHLREKGRLIVQRSSGGGNAMLYQNLILRKGEGIGWITVNRPEKLNALNIATVAELEAAFREFEADPEVKAIILTGTGEKAFVAGADIGEFSGLNAETGAHF